MKILKYAVLGLSVLAAGSAWGYGPGFGNAELFNSGWRFSLTDDSIARNPQYADTLWRKVDLPHDWSIEKVPSPSLASCQGYLPGGIGWYRKTFDIDSTGERRYIYFEGVYNRSDAYINGHHLGHRPNGYVSFLYDITPYLRQGENVLAVRVDHSRQADSRWYTGSGIYRDVYLVSAPESHFSLWGVGWKATSITDKEACVKVEAQVSNPQPGQKVTAELYDAEGRKVAYGNGKVVDGKCDLSIKVKNPHRWDTESPYLYRLETRLVQGGKTIDRDTETVGLRTLDFDPDKGFILNGRSMKVKGVCIHHDGGALGAAVPKEVWRRRLLNLKSIGVNALRMSHNPQAPDLYDLCDELGLLVMDEVSDEWEYPKRKWVEGWNVGTPAFEGTYDFFEEWIERDITDMVRRDRNHPCIFLWSIGNEVDYPNDPYSHPVLDGDGSAISQPMYGGYDPKAPSAERIGHIAKRLNACVKAVDDSRPTTGAMAGVVMSNQTEYPDAIDICGYNYTENRYATDHAAYPKRVIYGSETGVGYDQWRAVRDNDYIFGQFIWTGIDYLGESGRWPSRGLHTGLLDFTGLPKPRGQFRASLWLDEPFTYVGAYPIRNGGLDRRGRPMLSIDAPAVWNYDEGQPMRVVCYTNAPCAKLTLNGHQVGHTKPYDRATGIIYWDLPYSPGRLCAIGCDADGNEISMGAIETSGRPYALRASVEGERSMEPGAVNHVLIEIIDDEGRIVTLADNKITCRALAGTLLALETADNTDMGTNRAHSRRAHGGRLLAYVRNDSQGRMALSLTSPLLVSAGIE